MSLRDDLYTALIACIRAATGAGDDKVIIAGEKGPRPALPYLTVQILAYNISIGTDAIVRSTVLGVPKEAAQGSRYSTFDVQGFGVGAFDWLETLHGKLWLPSFVDTCMTQKLSLSLVGGAGVRDVSKLLDTKTERRGSLDLQADYRTLTDTATGIACLQVVGSMSYSREGSGGATLTPVITVNL